VSRPDERSGATKADPAPRQQPSAIQLRRRLFHLLAASATPLVSLFVPRSDLLMVVGAGLGVAVLVEAARRWSPAVNRLLLRWLGFFFKESERRTVTAATILAFATFLAFLVFPKHIAALSLLLLAVGDPAASVIGRLWGRLRFGGKSVEGTLAFFATASLVALVFWAAGGYSPLWAGALAAAAAALAEAVSGRPLWIDDNLTVPLVSGAVLTLAGA